MKKITYVTGNYGKYLSVKEKFENNNIIIEYANISIKEPDINSIEIISKEKAIKAYSELLTPVFVIDSGFYIRSYPNNAFYPGAFVKRSGISSNPEKLLEDMKEVKDRYCYFRDCLTYYDGTDFYQFFGQSEGELSKTIKGSKHQKAWSNLWYVFIPKNCTKTLAEMTAEERKKRKDNRVDVIIEFINWLNNNKNLIQKPKTLTK